MKDWGHTERGRQKMTATTASSYRRFTTDLRVIGSERTFVITEIESTTRHPMNWTDGSMTRESAWERAQAQIHHTIVVNLDGDMKDLGGVFSPAVFEQAAYRGYTGYGRSMTDGYYAPICFENWVKGFRKDVLSHTERLLAEDYDTSKSHMDSVFYGNDTPPTVCRGLQTYAYLLAQASK